MSKFVFLKTSTSRRASAKVLSDDDGPFLADEDCWECWWSFFACSLVAVDTDSWYAAPATLWTCDAYTSSLVVRPNLIVNRGLQATKCQRTLSSGTPLPSDRFRGQQHSTPYAFSLPVLSDAGARRGRANKQSNNTDKTHNAHVFSTPCNRDYFDTPRAKEQEKKRKKKGAGSGGKARANPDA